MFHHWTENVYFERFPKEISWIRSQNVFFSCVVDRVSWLLQEPSKLDLFEWPLRSGHMVHSSYQGRKKVWCALRLEFEKIKNHLILLVFPQERWGCSIWFLSLQYQLLPCAQQKYSRPVGWKGEGKTNLVRAMVYLYTPKNPDPSRSNRKFWVPIPSEKNRHWKG